MIPNRSLVRIQRLLDLKPADVVIQIREELDHLKNGNNFANLIYRKIEHNKKLINFLLNPDLDDHKRIGRVKYELDSINLLSAYMTNTRKRDIVDHESLFPVRRPDEPLKVYFTDKELEFYNAARQLFLDIIKRKSGWYIPVQLVEVMPQRIIASSIQGSFRKINDMIDRAQFEINLDDIDDFDTDGSSIILTGDEINRAKQLLSYQKEIGDTDSKFDAVLKRIKAYFRAGNDRIIIFSYFKHTIEYITEKLNNVDFSNESIILGQSIKAAFIHGNVAYPERNSIFEKFKDGSLQILVLSNIASEGIDLQHCNCLINYDLPWNPMKLEQRIGRLDRYGQKNVVLITNVYVVNSIEDKILYRLYKRINIVQENLLFLNPILKDFFSKRKDLIFQPDKVQEDMDFIIPKLEENLAARKKDLLKIQERIEDIKGPTSQALLYEAGLIQEKLNLFTLQELFTEFKYLIEKYIPGVRFISVEGNRDLISYCKENKIEVKGSLYALSCSESFLDSLKSLYDNQDQFQYELGVFMGRIRNSLRPRRNRNFKPILLTWDLEIASRFRDKVDLFSLKHILARIILNIIRTSSQCPDRFCSSVILADKVWKNDYLTFLFLLKSSGVVKISELKVISFDLKEEKLLADDKADIIYRRALESGKDARNRIPLKISNDIIDRAYTACFTRIVKLKSEIEKKYRIKVDEAYKYKKERTLQTYRTRIEKIKEKLHKTNEPRIIRMLKGQMKKTERLMESELETLSEKYNRSISLSIIEVAALIIKTIKVDDNIEGQ
ncbi:MAG: helicase-related protein, partial [Promethearchaeota archaeon]